MLGQCSKVCGSVNLDELYAMLCDEVADAVVAQEVYGPLGEIGCCAAAGAGAGAGASVGQWGRGTGGLVFYLLGQTEGAAVVSAVDKDGGVEVWRGGWGVALLAAAGLRWRVASTHGARRAIRQRGAGGTGARGTRGSRVGASRTCWPSAPHATLLYIWGVWTYWWA